jgi:proteasome lid subunit RPN8/RPN11
MPSLPWKIRSSLVHDLIRAAQKSHPNEFMAMLSVREKGSSIIDEIVVVPMQAGRDYATLHSELIPFDPLIVGTVHSHPTPSPFPSSQDLLTFARLGKVHAILHYPYSPDSLRVFDGEGEELDWVMV